MAGNINCPACGQADQVEKVSTLYLTRLGLNKGAAQTYRGPEEMSASSSTTTKFGAMTVSRQRALTRSLAPPSTSKEIPVRPIHPDLVVLTFSLALPIFLFGILTSQRGMLLPVLAILAVFYGFYIWKRKTMIARFERQVTSRRAADVRVKRGVERWMKLYYCARDEVVFEPGVDPSIPVDQMAGYLLEE